MRPRAPLPKEDDVVAFGREEEENDDDEVDGAAFCRLNRAAMRPIRLFIPAPIELSPLPISHSCVALLFPPLPLPF